MKAISHEYHTDHQRALVLGGGGPVGRAWQSGLVMGFSDQGVDLSLAELIVGTSAGALVGAKLALKQKFEPPASIGSTTTNSQVPQGHGSRMAELLRAMAKAVISQTPEIERAKIGQMALDAHTQTEEDSLARDVFSDFKGQAWPKQFRATAVNTRSGEFQVWDRESRVPLELALASSAALPGVWPPVTIGKDRYMDGGIRSMLNADLASGYRTIVVVSCFSLESPPAQKDSPFAVTNLALTAEVEKLRNSSSFMLLVSPSEEFLVLTQYGSKMLDQSLLPEAFKMGRIQGSKLAEQLQSSWNLKTEN